MAGRKIIKQGNLYGVILTETELKLIDAFLRRTANELYPGNSIFNTLWEHVHNNSGLELEEFEVNALVGTINLKDKERQNEIFKKVYAEIAELESEE